MEIKLTLPALVVVVLTIIILTFLNMKSKPIEVNDFSGSIINPLTSDQEIKDITKKLPINKIKK